MKIAIIGGGPIGVEAALYGACAGFDVQLYERGRLAENVRQWGHIQFFTEWGRNRSPLAIKLLSERGAALAPAESTSKGDELADYVLRLATLEPLRGRIAPQTQVVAVTRERCLKSDYIGSDDGGSEYHGSSYSGDACRTEFPFRLLLRGAFGEKIAHADVVIDASGVYATPNWAGSGGAPCLGEMENQRRIDYHLPDVAGRDRQRFANQHTLVIGSGHSAASSLRSICDLMDEFPRTRVTWVVRRDVPDHGYPYTLIPDDPSPHRDALHRRANELTEHPNVEFCPRTALDAIQHNGKYFRVQLSSFASEQHAAQTRQIECGNIVAHTGFRPDTSLWRELQFHEHPATGGPFLLSEQLIAANHRAGVGLSTGYAEKKPQQGKVAQGEKDEVAEEPQIVDRWRFKQNDPQLLHTGEPNFFVIGIKSYGRDAGFLMQNGFRQVRDIYKLIAADPALDLYEGHLE